MIQPVFHGMTALAVAACAALQPAISFAQSTSASAPASASRPASTPSDPATGAGAGGVRVAQAIAPASPADATAAIAATTTQSVEIVSRAQRLNQARTGIQTQTGASVYTFDSDAIAAMPGGDNVPLNAVLLQAPEVAQDSFGQFHVRGEHNGLQYRLDGVILPEGISVFGQSLDPRLISSLTLVTGALPAEYGLRTAGIIDIKTKTDSIEPGGSVSIYGGSHGTLQPSISYAGGTGDFHYFVSADALTSRLGIESPDGSADPLHDRTHQHHAFGYVEDILDADNRVGAGFGTSVGSFQIPDRGGRQPSLGLSDNGQTTYPSQDLDENQREITHFGFLSYQHSQGALDWQSSLMGRYSSLRFTPDGTGDLLYDGIAQTAYKRNTAVALQSDAAYRLNDAHTLRAGLFLQRDDSLSRTLSTVLPLDGQGNPGSVPETLGDDGNKVELLETLYVQDEWRVRKSLTINYGLRFDHFDAYTSAHQVSPRLNAVWKATGDTTLHAGYSRFFSPPPFELVGTTSVAKFANTTAAPVVTRADTPQPERANYFDVGLDQVFAQGWTGGIDLYYKRSRNLVDEGQFGAPIILTPFNYASGKNYGAELKLNYAGRALSAYGNLAFQGARGRDIDSAQFNFDPSELAYIGSHDIHVDHEQKISASAGLSYLWRGTRFSGDALLGTGLRSDETLADGSTVPNGAHLPTYTQVNLGVSRRFELGAMGDATVRLDVINAFDRVYEIRDGSGVGVGAPQYGPRRGFFVGVSKSL